MVARAGSGGEEEEGKGKDEVVEVEMSCGWVLVRS